MALGGGRRRPKGLPRRIIFFHILPRLPVSSLQRCRSVCKQWHSFLKSRFFANMHNRHITNGSSLQLQPSLFFLSVEEPFEFRIIDFEAPDDDGSIPRRHAPFPFVLGDDCSITYTESLSSLHGLVVLQIHVRMHKKPRDTNIDNVIIFWNPLTDEYRCKFYPYSKFFFPLSLELYYNATDDDYKLLTLSSYDLGVHIYSLKSDSWRNVDSTNNYQTLSHFKPSSFGKWGLHEERDLSNGTLLNGNLYFLYNNIKNDRGSVLKFDTKIEKFTLIPTPPCLMDLDVKCLSMNAYEDVIHLGVKYEISRYVYSTNAYIQMWRMIGDHGNWEKVGGHYKVDNLLKPLDWIGNKTWVMMKKKCYFGDIYKVDHNKGTWIISNYMDNATVVVNYTKSFMSLNRSI